MDMTSPSLYDEGQFITIQEPVRMVATTGTDEAKKVLQEGYDMKYQAEIAIYLKRVDLLKANANKAYAMIMDDYCTKAMKTRIQEHPDYATVIQDNPFKLLETIKAGMHEPLRAQYPFVSKVEHVANLINCRQASDEDVITWGKRFKQNLDLTIEAIGKGAVDKVVEATPEYAAAADPPPAHLLTPDGFQGDEFLDIKESAAQIELKQEAWDAFEGYLFIRNSDQDKYGSFIKGLQTQFSLGQDQYPKSLQKAIDALAMQRFDQRYFDKRKREADQKRQQRQAQQDEPPETPARSTSFAQTTPGGRPPRTTSGRPSNAICHCCGVQGHVANDCPEKGNIPKEEWFVKQAIGAYQDRQAQDQSQDDDSDSDDDSVQSTRSTRSDRSTPAASRRSATPTSTPCRQS